MIKLEQKFLTAYRAKWKAQNPDGLWHKISDAPTAHQIAKPFDAFSAYRGVSTAYEAKSIKGAATLKFSDLRQSQVDGLMLAFKNGWGAMVLAYYHDTQEYMAVPFINLRQMIVVEKGDFPLCKIKV